MSLESAQRLSDHLFDAAIEEGMSQSDRFSIVGSCGADTPTVSTCLSRRSASDLEDRGLPQRANSGSAHSTTSAASCRIEIDQGGCNSSGCLQPSLGLHGRDPVTCCVGESDEILESGFITRDNAAYNTLASLGLEVLQQQHHHVAQFEASTSGMSAQFLLKPPGLHMPCSAEPTEAAPETRTGRLPTESIGSVLHSEGLCKPCAWYWKPQSCENGRHCLHCHLCGADEPRRRRKQKKEFRRAVLRAAPA